MHCCSFTEKWYLYTWCVTIRFHLNENCSMKGLSISKVLLQAVVVYYLSSTVKWYVPLDSGEWMLHEIIEHWQTKELKSSQVTLFCEHLVFMWFMMESVFMRLWWLQWFWSWVPATLLVAILEGSQLLLWCSKWCRNILHQQLLITKQKSKVS